MSATLRMASGAESRADWFARPFQYVVINQDLRGILTEFGRNVGVPVILTDKVTGRVRGEVTNRASAEQQQTAGQFLNRLAEGNALTWYFDGAALYLSSDQEFSTQIIDVGSVKAEAVVAELERLSLMDDRFSVRGTGSAGMISASGPPAFVGIVRQVAEKLRPPAAVAADNPVVQIFRGGAPAETVRVPRDTTRARDTSMRVQGGAE